MLGLALAGLVGVFLAALQAAAGAPSDRSIDVAAMAAAALLLAMLALPQARAEMARTLRRAGPALIVCLGLAGAAGLLLEGPGAVPYFLEARQSDVLLWAACGLAALAVAGASRVAGRRYLALGVAAAGGAFALVTVLRHISALSAGGAPEAMTGSFGDANAAAGGFAAIAIAGVFSTALETGRIGYRTGQGLPPLHQRLALPAGAAVAAGLALFYVESAAASLVVALAGLAVAGSFALRKRGALPAAAALALALGFAGLTATLAALGAPLPGGLALRGSIADVAVPAAALLATLATILAGRDAKRTPSRGLGLAAAVGLVAGVNALGGAPLLESPAAALTFACLAGLAVTFADPPQRASAAGQLAGDGRGARRKASAAT